MKKGSVLCTYTENFQLKVLRYSAGQASHTNAGSFRKADHFQRILAEAQTIAGAALGALTQQLEIASK